MFHRIKGVIIQELFITKHSLEVIIDLFYFSVITVVVFGFVSIFLAGETNKQAAYYLLLGMILWEIIRVTQYSVSVGSLWNIWSRNLSNMFVTPLSLKEYMIAEMIAGAIKTLLIMGIVSLVAIFVFDFNLFQIGIANFFLFFFNLTLFAWAIGIAILALIFRYGTRIQALAWGLVFIFQPLTAAFFPLSVLPDFLQKVAQFIPATHVFEAARRSLSNPQVDWTLFTISFVENIVYLALAIWFFAVMFRISKDTGQFARNEG